jgi:hypothetical protein
MTWATVARDGALTESSMGTISGGKRGSVNERDSWLFSITVFHLVVFSHGVVHILGNGLHTRRIYKEGTGTETVQLYSFYYMTYK